LVRAADGEHTSKEEASGRCGKIRGNEAGKRNVQPAVALTVTLAVTVAVTVAVTLAGRRERARMDGGREDENELGFARARRDSRELAGIRAS
jgi:hypothetical protein